MHKQLLLFAVVLAGTACDPKPAPTRSTPPAPPTADATKLSGTTASVKPKEIIHTALFDGSDSFTHTGMKQFLGDDPIKVDFAATYHFSAIAKASGSDAGQERQYLGFACYDVDGNGISTYHVAKYPGATDTTLAADLNPGDRQIVLTDATGWNNLGAEHRCAIAWYGYTNQEGHTYPDYTYTRHFVADLWEADAITDNTITLSKEWPGPALQAGTAVRNAASGGTYNYALNGGAAVPDTATAYKATVSGVWQDGEYSDTVFRPGAAFIRPLVLANWSNTQSTLSVSDFRIREIPAP